MDMEHCRLSLAFNRALDPRADAGQLRGAIAALQSDNVLFHQHGDGDRFVYRYPLIQYKIVDNQAMMVGLGAGAPALARLNLLELPLTIGRQEYVVEEQEMKFKRVTVGCSEKPLVYGFKSPWLALNVENSRSYRRMGTSRGRKDLLERILVANLISFSKGVGYDVAERLTCRVLEAREVDVELKGNPMIGFWGVFSVNFRIPEYIGIGKSVSRGFGTIASLA